MKKTLIVLMTLILSQTASAGFLQIKKAACIYAPVEPMTVEQLKDCRLEIADARLALVNLKVEMEKVWNVRDNNRSNAEMGLGAGSIGAFLTSIMTSKSVGLSRGRVVGYVISGAVMAVGAYYGVSNFEQGERQDELRHYIEGTEQEMDKKDTAIIAELAKKSVAVTPAQ